MDHSFIHLQSALLNDKRRCFVARLVAWMTHHGYAGSIGTGLLYDRLQFLRHLGALAKVSFRKNSTKSKMHSAIQSQSKSNGLFLNNAWDTFSSIRFER